MSGCGDGSDPARAVESIRTNWTKAFAVARPLAGRLAGVGYAPAAPVPAAGPAAPVAPAPLAAATLPAASPSEATVAAERRTFAGLSRSAVRTARTRSAWDLYALGLAALGVGRVDAAVDHLAAAAARMPAKPEPWSDLAAAYLERGDRRHLSHDDLLALDAADRALQLAPGLAPAAFNRAVALERLFLPAAAAWQRFLASDRSSGRGWPAEARRHLAAAGSPEPIDAWTIQRRRLEDLAAAGKPEALASWARRVPQAVRELAEDVELPAWGGAVLAGRGADAGRALAIARALGGALAAGRGGTAVADCVRAIDLAGAGPGASAGYDTSAAAPVSPGGRSALHDLAAAHAVYGQALALYASEQFAGAQVVFDRAAALFVGAGSPFAGWARFQLARCAFQHLDYDRAVRLLEPLTGAGAAGRDAALAGRAWVLDGLIAAIVGRPFDALAAWQQGREVFTRLGERGSLISLDAGAAEVLASLGRRAESWTFLLRALSETSAVDPVADLGHALERAAVAAQEDGAFAAAIDFRDEQLRRALASGSARRTAGALFDRAMAYSGAGNRPLALHDIEAARRMAAAMPDSGLRTSATADILYTEGRIRRRFDAASAIPPLAEAARIFAATGYRYPLVTAHLELGLATLALRQDDRAESELQAAAAAVEHQRGAIPDSSTRSTYLGQMREVYEAIVELEAGRRRRPEPALAASELYRGRTLLDLLQGGRSRRERGLTLGPSVQPVPAAGNGAFAASQPLAPRDIAAALPAGTAGVEFAFAHGRLFTWVVTPGGLRLFASDLGAHAERRIGVLAQRLRGELRTGRVGRGSAAVLLDDLLLQPIEPALPAGARLVLAPDGPLSGLPFAALRDRQGRYLIARHALLLAPSLSYFVASRRSHRSVADRSAGGGSTSGRAPLRVLAVGDPAFDPAVFGDLPRLPGAAAEAAAVARLLPGSVALVGAQASAANLLAAVDRFPILHFAGHAIANPAEPLLSYLLLASDAPGGASVLYARDVLDYRFDRTRLALLAACRTADDQSTSGQGVMGLASVFLAAGVPAVIATLWDVEDPSSGALLDRFYRRLARGVDAADALRAAQLDLLASSDPALRQPATWAGFEIIGDPPAFLPQPVPF